MTNTTLYTILKKNIEKYKSRKVLFSENKDGQWTGISWIEFGEKVEATAKALLELSVNVGDRIAIFSQNMPEWTITDYAIQAIRGVSVPLYATSSVSQALYILDETETKFIFAGEQDQYNKAIEIAKKSKSVKKIIVFDSGVALSNEFDSVYFSDFCKTGNNETNQSILKQRTDEGDITDLLTIIYTSGTSGEPKGVMLHQSNLIFCIEIHKKRLVLKDTDISMCFLPLSHVFERGWTFVILSNGISNYYNRNPREIVNKIKVVKPNLMCAVPRFFEKSYNVVLSTVEKSSPLKKKIFTWAIKTGNKRVELLCNENPVPFGLHLKYKLADLLVLKKGRAAFGGQIRYMPSAGAALSEEIIRFFHAAGITILFGYGLTESTATVSCYPYTKFKFGSVGKIMPDIQVKIGENKEILVKGDSITSGYFNKPKATQEAFIDGWFRTGDAGSIDEEGNIFMTDRIKDIFKTSSGKFIAPQMIEGLLGNSPFVDQVAIIGNERKFVSALIVPAFDSLNDWAKNNGISISDRAELLKNEQILKLYSDTIAQLQKDLSSFEQVKKFTLLSKEFSINGGELTDTLKVKRNVVNEKYSVEIAMMYLD
jgi:long-chain acyl-CoA synthetase